MALDKGRLYFDETDVAGSDQVGAHVLGSSNNKVTSTTDGAKEALDVNVVLQSGIYDEDAAHSDGDKGTHMLAVRQDTLASSTSADGDYGSLKASSLGEIYVKDSDVEGELQTLNTVDFATETTLGGIKTTTDQITFDGSGNLNVAADIDIKSAIADNEEDTENPIKMGSHAFASLSVVDSGDKADLASDLYRRVHVNGAANIGIKNSAESVTTTAAEVVATPLAGRKKVVIQNKGNKDIYLGFDNTVSSSNGIEIPARATFSEEIGENIDVFLIADSGTQDVRILELA